MISAILCFSLVFSIWLVTISLLLLMDPMKYSWDLPDFLSYWHQLCSSQHDTL